MEGQTMLPSYKTLEREFPGKGKELRELLEGKRKTRSYKSVQSLERQCYHPPRYQERMETALNEVLEGFGAEAIFGDSCTQPDAVYINMGETYAATLLFDYARGRWLVTSWGDWVEAQERKGKVYA